MSRFDDQLTRGLERLRIVAGKTVTYRRGAQSVSLTAVTGRSEYTTVDDAGMPVSNQMRDFLIEAAALVLSATQTVPVVGDTIDEVDGTQTRTHVVVSIGDGQPWQWSDPARTTMRIHTRERGVA